MFAYFSHKTFSERCCEAETLLLKWNSVLLLLNHRLWTCSKPAQIHVQYRQRQTLFTRVTVLYRYLPQNTISALQHTFHHANGPLVGELDERFHLVLQMTHLWSSSVKEELKQCCGATTIVLMIVKILIVFVCIIYFEVLLQMKQLIQKNVEAIFH